MAKQCIGCGKELGFFSLKKLITKDNQFLCDKCKDKLFPNQNGMMKTNTINQWVSKSTSATIKHYLENDTVLTANADGTVNGDNNLFCPNCGSSNVQPLGRHHQGFSAGKAAAGVALTGGIGLAAGMLGKNTNQTDFVCMDCGKQFKK